MTLEPFERSLLDYLLSGDAEPLPALRAQLARATVATRVYSGVGAFTTFAVPDDVPRVIPPGFTISDVAYDMAGVENGGGVILFVRGGRLDGLEVFNWTDPWPVNPKFSTITFLAPAGPVKDGAARNLIPTPTRDFAALAAQISS